MPDNALQPTPWCCAPRSPRSRRSLGAAERERWADMTLVATILLLSPRLALAHGEELLLLPLGQFISLVVAVIMSLRIARLSLVGMSVVLATALGVAFATWMLPPNMYKVLFGDSLPGSGSRFLLIGLIPGALAGVVALIWERLGSEDHDGT